MNKSQQETPKKGTPKKVKLTLTMEQKQNSKLRQIINSDHVFAAIGVNNTDTYEAVQTKVAAFLSSMKTEYHALCEEVRDAGDKRSKQIKRAAKEKATTKNPTQQVVQEDAEQQGAGANDTSAVADEVDSMCETLEATTIMDKLTVLCKEVKNIGAKVKKIETALERSDTSHDESVCTE